MSEFEHEDDLLEESLIGAHLTRMAQYTGKRSAYFPMTGTEEKKKIEEIFRQAGIPLTGNEEGAKRPESPQPSTPPSKPPSTESGE